MNDAEQIEQILSAIVYQSSVDGRDRHIPAHVRAAIVMGISTYIGSIRAERDAWERRARELESLCADRL